jgi:hypothetical protein
MNPQDILRYVDSLHRDKNIDPELLFQAIESALQSAAKKQYGEDSDVIVSISRDNGAIAATLVASKSAESVRKQPSRSSFKRSVKPNAMP